MKARKKKGDGSMLEPKPNSTARVGMEQVFFDVPVYRLSKNEYESGQNDFIHKNLYHALYAEETYRRHPEVKTQIISHLWSVYGGTWLFNEIIGFIRLYFFFSQIRGEYIQTLSKRKTRTRHKVFSPLGHEVTFPENIPQGSSNQEIFKLILRKLSRAQGEKELKGRYIYTATFEKIGPHIDWNALLQEQYNREKLSNSCKPIATR